MKFKLNAGWIGIRLFSYFCKIDLLVLVVYLCEPKISIQLYFRHPAL